MLFSWRMSRILLRPHSHTEFLYLARAFAAERRAGAPDATTARPAPAGFEPAARNDDLQDIVRSYAESLPRPR